MGLNKKLWILCAILATLFVGQLAVLRARKPGEKWVAHWARNPKSIDEAKNLADQIVRGRVTSVRRADDLVMRVPGEPSDTDRIPVEVVTFKVEGAYKGTPPASVEVFHTGLSPLDVQGRPIPPRPRNVPRKPQANPTPLQRRTIFLVDDPPYSVGERYVLFLTVGPTLTVAGAGVSTQALVSPAGRYIVAQGDTLVPVSSVPFAVQLRGKKLSILEGHLPAFKPRP